MLHFVDTSEDGQGVRAGRVGGQSQVAFMEHVVNVVVIFLEHLFYSFQSGLFHGILLNAFDAVGYVTAEDKDTQQFMVVIVDGHHPELIVESAPALHAFDTSLLERNLV